LRAKVDVGSREDDNPNPTMHEVKIVQQAASKGALAGQLAERTSVTGRNCETGLLRTGTARDMRYYTTDGWEKHLFSRLAKTSVFAWQRNTPDYREKPLTKCIAKCNIKATVFITITKWVPD